MDLAWIYFQSPGVVGNSCLEYEAKAGTCTQKCDAGQAYGGNVTQFQSSNCFKLNSVADMQAEIVTNGPIQSGYTVYSDFYNYNSGVYIYDGTSPSEGGHAIRIIGWGTDSGVDYWLVANSWGTGFGIDGYFKIRRGTDEAGIESNAVAGMAVTAGVHAYEEYPSKISTSNTNTVHAVTVLLLVCLSYFN